LREFFDRMRQIIVLLNALDLKKLAQMALFTTIDAEVRQCRRFRRID
jgi:hypothetical protein